MLDRKTNEDENLPGMVNELIGMTGSRSFKLNENQMHDLLRDNFDLKTKMDKLTRKAHIQTVLAYRNRFSNRSVMKFIFELNMDEGYCDF